MTRKLKKLTKVTNLKHINAYVATYKLSNGSELNYEFCTRRQNGKLSLQTNNHTFADAVKILPYYKKDGKTYVVFIKEFRHALNDYIYSVPAGLVEENEPLENSVRRELLEEIGAQVINLTCLCPPSYVSVGLTDETLACFLAQVSLSGKQQLEPTEEITLHVVEKSQLSSFLANHVVDLGARLMATIFELHNK